MIIGVPTIRCESGHNVAVFYEIAAKSPIVEAMELKPAGVRPFDEGRPLSGCSGTGNPVDDILQSSICGRTFHGEVS